MDKIETKHKKYFIGTQYVFTIFFRIRVKVR